VIYELSQNKFLHEMLDLIRVRMQPTPRNFIPFLKVSYEEHRAIVAGHRIFSSKQVAWTAALKLSGTSGQSPAVPEILLLTGSRNYLGKSTPGTAE
jgi:hypothetical protein